MQRCVELANGARDVVRGEDGRDHCRTVHAGTAEHLYRVSMQPADSYHGNRYRAADARKFLCGHIDGIRLGGSGDERSDAEIIRACRLCGERLIDGLGGDADDRIGT